MATVKRIRFGLVFDGARPCMDGGDFLKEIGLVEVEGVQKDGKHHLLFTVCKPRRTLDVQSAIDAYNRRHGDVIREATVTTFERGNKYLTHPICQAIQRSDASYWSWSVVMAEDQMVNDLESTLSEAPAEDMPSMEAPAVEDVQDVQETQAPPPSPAKKQKRKRAISELQSNLVETVLVPSAAKRSSTIAKSGKENAQVGSCFHYGLLCIGMFSCFFAHTEAVADGVVQIGKKPTSTKSTKKRSSTAPSSKKTVVKMQSSSSRQFDSVDVMMLVTEVAKSKEATISAKDHLIRVLETSLARRVCASCGAE